MILKNKFYYFIASIYSKILNSFENYFLKNTEVTPSLLMKEGYELLNLKQKIIYNSHATSNVNVNKMLNKDIAKYSVISDIINQVFIKSKLKDVITNKTGFNYSIDFLMIYKTYSINASETGKEWYANHWHKDRPFSPNTIKVIIPLDNNILEEDGGIEIVNLEKSKKNIDNNEKNFYRMNANLDQALVFFPNKCFHRAGNPQKQPRKQIMFQLNPSSNWRINKNIELKQFKIEPKFPLFSYLFDTYISFGTL